VAVKQLLLGAGVTRSQSLWKPKGGPMREGRIAARCIIRNARHVFDGRAQRRPSLVVRISQRGVLAASAGRRGTSSRRGTDRGQGPRRLGRRAQSRDRASNYD